MLYFLVALFLILNSYFIIPAPVHAQPLPYGWQINNFESNVNIQSDGKVKVVETIDVDFDGLEKHGIFREIPYIYTDENTNKTYSEIEVGTIKRNGAEENHTTSKSNGYIQIKIGNAKRTISGNQTYEITYLATGVLRSFGNYDELYWNVTGNYWDVPILSTTATVSAAAPITNAVCYMGTVGSKQNCTLTNAGSSEIFKAGPLSPGEGLTAVVAYQKGIIPILQVATPSSDLNTTSTASNFPHVNWLLAIGLYLLSAIGGTVYVISRWTKNGRDLYFNQKHLFDPAAKMEPKPVGKHETIVVEYSPPENLKPAEIGVLMDEKADTADVTATIIDLAQGGYLAIKEEPKKWLFGNTDYVLSKKNKSQNSLEPYEKLLLDKIFEDGDLVKISELKNTFYSHLVKVKSALYEDVVSKKLFPQDPDTVRGKYLAFGIFGFFGSIFLPLLAGVGLLTPVIYLSFLISGLSIPSLLLIFLSRSMPRRTAEGHQLYLRAQGYYLFVDKAEKYRQRFFENKNMLNEVLPYAIVFGLTEKFAQAMATMGIQPQQVSSWYVGAHPLNFTTFSNNIQSFSTGMSRAMASTPHKSGGFSSTGGSSGGGFGGGGGGSW